MELALRPDPLAALAIAAATALIAAAQQENPRTTFRSGLDLLTFETSVVDANGRPVDDLRADEFEVRVDGELRKVVSVRPIVSDADRVSNTGAPIAQYVSPASQAAGRAVVLAIDRESIRSGNERPLLDTAAGMLDSLSGADAAAVVSLPAVDVRLSRDHALAAATLRSLTGTRPLTHWTHEVSWDEALAYDQRDRLTIERVVERECRPGDPLGDRCGEELKDQAREMLLIGRGHTQTVLTALTSLLDALSTIHGPKRLVLISGGLPFDVQLLRRYEELALKAAQTRVVLHVVHVDQPSFDASTGRSVSAPFGGREMATGLGNIAASTGGLMFAGVGRAAGAFARLATDINHSYELAIESRASDGNGRTHSLDVKVIRPGLTTRSPRAIAVPALTTARDNADSLVRALQQPVDVADLPIAIATYVTHAADPGAVRVLVAAQLAARATSPPVEWGFVVLKGPDIIATVKHPRDGAIRNAWNETASIDLPAGRYRLRFAAIDADGRMGVIEVPLTAGLRAAGPARLSDLIVGPSADGRLQPSATIGDGAHAMIELSGVDADAVTVRLELIRGGTSTAALQQSLEVGARADGVLIASAAVKTAGLEPGRYTASATVLQGGEPLARVSRIVDVVASPTVTEPSPAATSTSRNAPDVESLIQKVAQYVERYGEEASLIVGVEKYDQRYSPPQLGEPSVRRLVSEFALVRTREGWMGFRDVAQVDGKEVEHRRDRLLTLFRSGPADLVAARRIADESARFNIGAIVRNLNVPTTALFFFTPHDLRRFSFSRKGQATIDGTPVWEIAFHEKSRPTFIHRATGEDVPAEGSLWVSPSDGTVVRSTLSALGFTGAASVAHIEVQYHRDPHVGLWVPARMEERYEGTVRGRSGRLHFGRATAVATYSDFKRFETSTSFTIK